MALSQAVAYWILIATRGKMLNPFIELKTYKPSFHRVIGWAQGHHCVYQKRLHDYLSSGTVSQRREKAPEITCFKSHSQCSDPARHCFPGLDTQALIYRLAFWAERLLLWNLSHPQYNVFIKSTLWVKWVTLSVSSLNKCFRSPSWTSRAATRSQLAWPPAVGRIRLKRCSQSDELGWWGRVVKRWLTRTENRPPSPGSRTKLHS